MPGKIFPESSSIYEDQARILFEYYRSAAEGIVSQEIDLEKKIEDVHADNAAGSLRLKTLIKTSIIGGSAVLVLGLIALFVVDPIVGLVLILGGGAFFGVKFFLGNKKEKAFQLSCDSKITAFGTAKDGIRRDYKVHKVGAAYVPVATRVPFQEQSFLVDNTGTLENHRFTLFDIKDKAGLVSAAGKMEEVLATIPVVDSTDDAEMLDTSALSESIPRINLGDWASNLDRQVRRLNYQFTDLNEISVDVPVIDPRSELSAFLERHGNDETPEHLKVRLFDTSGQKEALSSFEAIAEMSQNRTSGEGKSVEDFCRSLMERAAATIQMVSDGRSKSLLQMNNYGVQSLGMLMKGSFNYYSPELEAENIQRVREDRFNFTETADSWEPLTLNRSSQVRYDLFSDNWVAEDGSRTSNPFGIHQIFEEIFMPMVSSLMKENRLERLKVYNDIRNQKIDYLNQWHRDTEDFYARNRAEINELSNRIRSVTADYLSDLNTYKVLSETVKGMESGGSPERIKELHAEEDNIAIMMAQAQSYGQFIENFTGRFESYRTQINDLAQDFEHIEFFEASLRDGEARDAAQALATTDWDERRRVLIKLGHQIARNSTLPPAPKVEDRAERDSMINLFAMYENVKEELAREERSAADAASRDHAPSAAEHEAKSEEAPAPEAPAEPAVPASDADMTEEVSSDDPDDVRDDSDEDDSDEDEQDRDDQS